MALWNCADDGLLYSLDWKTRWISMHSNVWSYISLPGFLAADKTESNCQTAWHLVKDRAAAACWASNLWAEGSVGGSKGFEVPYLNCFLFSTQPLWILWQQWENCRNEEPGGEMQTNLHISLSVWNFALAWLARLALSLSHLMKVLQEWCVWAEDAGRSWGCDDMYSLWSEARSVALQLHCVHELHREVAHMNAHGLMQCVRAWSDTGIGSTHADLGFWEMTCASKMQMIDILATSWMDFYGFNNSIKKPQGFSCLIHFIYISFYTRHTHHTRHKTKNKIK